MHRRKGLRKIIKNHWDFLCFACLVRPKSTKNNKFSLEIHAVSGAPFQIDKNLGKTNVWNELGNASKNTLKPTKSLLFSYLFDQKACKKHWYTSSFQAVRRTSKNPLKPKGRTRFPYPWIPCSKPLPEPTKIIRKVVLAKKVCRNHYTK